MSLADKPPLQSGVATVADHQFRFHYKSDKSSIAWHSFADVPRKKRRRIVVSVYCVICRRRVDMKGQAIVPVLLAALLATGASAGKATL